MSERLFGWILLTCSFKRAIGEKRINSYAQGSKYWDKLR